MKLQEKFRAIDLRKSGKSYSDILKTISVSRGTLSLWLRDVNLSDLQKQELKGRQISRLYGAEANKKKRIEQTNIIVSRAQEEAKELFKSPLFLSGLMLYWAEGDKSELQERVKFTNSDPQMIALAMRWLREICQVPEEKFRVCIHIHSLHTRENIEKYWSKITNIPLSQFHKTQIKQTSLGQRRNKAYEGTCAVTVNNRSLFRRIKGWKIGFLERINTI